MEDYLHRVVGIYPTHAEAAAARDRLVERGLPEQCVQVLERGDPESIAQLPKADSDDVLHEMVRDGAIGTAVGAAAGAVGTAAIAAAGVSLFVASPLIAPLAMLGWGAGLGGLLGAAAGARSHRAEVADLVKDALRSGHFVLLAYTRTEEQTTLAQQIVGESLRDPDGARDS